MLKLMLTIKNNDMSIWANGENIELSFNEEPNQDIINNIKTKKQDIISFLRINNVFSEEEFNNLVSEANEQDNVEFIFPATSLQQGFVFHHLNQPQDDAYRVQVLFDYHKDLNISAYQRAWQLASMRYPILRTGFNWEGEILQVITKQPGITEANFEIKDISNTPEEKRDEIITQIQQQDRAVPFDLSKPGLIRFTLIKQKDNLFTVLKSEHHIIADGWSSPILLQTVHDYYNALIQGKTPIVEVETAYLEAQSYYQNHSKEIETYWLKAKQDFGESNDINLLLSQSNDLTQVKSIEQPAEQILVVDGADYQQLKRSCQNQGVTLNASLQFAWHKLLHTYTQDEQTIVGTIVSGRDIPVEGVESSVGLYINTLPLIVNWQDKTSIEEMLNCIQKSIAELNSYSSVSLASLQKNGERLFHSLFVFENYPTPAESDSDASSSIESSLEFRQAVEKVDYPLSIMAFESGESLVVKFRYGKDWLTDMQANRLLAQMRQILNALAMDPKQSHQAISLISEDERQTLLHTWNQTDAPYPMDKTLAQLFEAQVEKTPNNIALVFEGEELTYQQLNQRANQLACAIRENYQLQTGTPLQPDTLIALYFDRSLEMIISIMAVLKAGGAYVPISPEYPQARTQFVLEDTQSVLVLTQQQHVARLTEWIAELANPPSLLDTDDLACFSHHPQANLKPMSGPSDLAYVIYTSGTTGQPKGVMIEHRNVSHYVQSLKHSLTEDIINVDFSSNYCFDLSVSTNLCPLLLGKRILIYGGDITDINSYQRHIIRHQVDFIKTTPSLATITLSNPKIKIKTLLLGGEELTNKHVKELSHYAQFIFDEYGPTESTVGALLAQKTYDIKNGIGKAYANIQLYNLSNSLLLTPIGSSGELYIGGAGLARGYLNQPALTKEKFIDNPFATEADKAKGYTRLYKTGDLVRWLPDGNLEFLGRIDRQVKLRGHRIELDEIESVIGKVSGLKNNAVKLDTSDKDNPKIVAYGVVDDKKFPACFNTVAMLIKQDVHEEQLHRLANGIEVCGLNRSESEHLHDEIFMNHAYDKFNISINEGDCIFDVGANIGMFSIFIMTKVNDVKIFAFEPIPKTCNVLKINMDIFGQGRVIAKCLGLSDTEKQAEFNFYPEVSVISGINKDRGDNIELVKNYIKNTNAEIDNGTILTNDILDELLKSKLVEEKVLVELSTVSAQIKANKIEKIDLLKIDVERSEIDVLSGIEPQDWGKIKQVVIEVHDVNNSLDIAIQILKKQGFIVDIDQEDALINTELYNVYARRNTLPKKQSTIDDSSWLSRYEFKKQTLEVLAETLPSHMVPSTLILLDKLPLTSNGKTDYNSLFSTFEAPYLKEIYVAPRNEIEQTLCSIWQNVLELEQVGIHDNFFRIGGNSITAIKLTAESRKMFQVDIPLPLLFEQKTIAGIASKLDQQTMTIIPKAEVCQYPLSFAQERLLFIERFESGTDAYHIPHLVQLNKTVNLVALEAAFNVVINHHPVLKTIYLTNDDEESYQHILEQDVPF
ncbi:amino acid adenylation domain-containing protein, partial [Rheinheimera baltica]